MASTARSRRVQNQPCGRRRSRARRTSCAITARRSSGRTSRSRRTVSGSSGRGGAQLGPEHVRVLRVEHGRLDRTSEDRRRVVHQVGVQRVVTGDQQRQGASPARPGPAGLLPQRRAGAGPAGQQYGVQTGDVDAELQRVGRRDPGQLAALQHGLQPPALLRQVARPVGRHLVGQPGSTSARFARAVSATVSAPRLDRTNATVRTPVTTRSASRSATSAVGRPSYRSPVPAAVARSAAAPTGRTRSRRAASRRRSPPPSAGRSAARRHRRVGDRRRGADEDRVGAVVPADPPQPPQHRRHVRAEHAAVVVALVDHDVLQTAAGSAPSAGGSAGPSGAACPGWSARTSRGREPSRARLDPSRRPASSRAGRARSYAARPRSWSCASALVGDK